MPLNEALERMCRRVVRPTSSMRLNYLTVGVPAIVGPEEAEDQGFALLAPNGRETVLTFRVPPPDDLYVLNITLIMWRIVNDRLVYIPTPSDGGAAAAGAVPAEVRFTFFDGANRRDMNDQEQEWSFFAGKARYPMWVQPPHALPSSRIFCAKFRNYETEELAVSLNLHCVRRRTQQPDRGWTQSDQRVFNELFHAAEQRGELSEAYMSPDYMQNIADLGAYKTMPVPRGPVTITPQNVGTMPTPVNRVILADRRYAFFAKQLMGRQQVVTPAADEFLTPDNIRAVMVRMYDQNEQYWITNQWVPMAALFGDGGRPYKLSPTWAWGRNANISIDLCSFDSQSVSCSLMAEGWWRDTRVRAER